MCLDGNTASLSVRYMNAQLHALWENAKECSSQGHYSDFKSTEYEKSKYTRALGEYHFLSKKSPKGLSIDELFFFAKFAAPKLEFICNHEAVLHLTIESGHLNLAHKDAGKPGARADKSKKCPISNLEVVFRVPFLRTNVKGHDARIGNDAAKHLIQMIVLRFNEARLLMYSPDQSLSADLKEALRFYMKQYLCLVESAGNHVFFDLPDFDDNKHRPVSNYALIHDQGLDALRKEHSEDIKLLGELECSLLSRFYDMYWLTHSSQRSSVEAWGTLEICLATICSDWIIGSEMQKNFFINFNKPIIEPLCPHEVIIKFHIKEVAFFGRANIDKDCEPTHQYSDWQIAFIVEVGKPEGGGLVQLNLDSARFSRHHSSFGACAHSVDVIVLEHIEYIISFISVDYLDLISRSQLHIVLGFPSIPGTPSPYFDESWSETSEGEDSGSYTRQHGRLSLWSERIATTIYGGYDQAIALSEASINLVLQSRHTAVTSWKKDKFFSMELRPLTIRLLSNGKAIVYVQAEGKIGVKKTTAFRRFWCQYGFSAPVETDELEEFDFETITLAYEVDLKLQSHDHLKKTLETKTTTTTTTVGTETSKQSSGSFLGRTVSKLSHAWDHVTGNIQKCAEKNAEATSTQTKKTTIVKTETVVVSEMFHLMHLVLDYTNASYVRDLSEVTALGNGDEALERLATVQHYLPQYLHELIHFGHHILHTVPICKTQIADANIFAFTCVDFKVLTKREITIKTCSHGERNTTEMPLVLLYGMCLGQREMAPFVGSWLPGLVPVGPKAVGTLALSYQVFMHRCLIEPLKLINEATTIVPSAVDVVDDVWHIDLCSWEQHKTRSQSKTGCAWSLMQRDVPSGCMGYEWKYRDEWSHEHEGSSSDDANGEYKLACNTHNKLIIPLSYNRKGLNIVMSGESSVALSGKADHEKWTKRSSAKWEAVIKVDTMNGGMKVSVDYKTPHLSLVDEHPHCCHFDIVAKHREVMASKLLDFENRVLPKLRLAVENTWKYTTMGIQTVSLRDPVFTKKGDLICELDLNKDAIESLLIDKTEWESHCNHLFTKTVSQGAGQINYANGKSANVSGYLQYGNGSSDGNGYNIIQSLTANKPTTALSGYSLTDSQHEQDSLSEDEEDHDGN